MHFFFTEDIGQRRSSCRVHSDTASIAWTSSGRDVIRSAFHSGPRQWTSLRDCIHFVAIRSTGLYSLGRCLINTVLSILKSCDTCCLSLQKEYLFMDAEETKRYHKTVALAQTREMPTRTSNDNTVRYASKSQRRWLQINRNFKKYWIEI